MLCHLSCPLGPEGPPLLSYCAHSELVQKGRSSRRIDMLDSLGLRQLIVFCASQEHKDTRAVIGQNRAQTS